MALSVQNQKQLQQPILSQDQNLPQSFQQLKPIWLLPIMGKTEAFQLRKKLQNTKNLLPLDHKIETQYSWKQKVNLHKRNNSWLTS